MRARSPRAVHIHHAGHRPQNRSERRSTEPKSSCPACRQAGVLPRLWLWVAAGQPTAILCREVPCSQRSDFICRSTPGEEMKLWIWSSHLSSPPSSPSSPPSQTNTCLGGSEACRGVSPLRLAAGALALSLDDFGKADSTGPSSCCDL